MRASLVFVAIFVSVSSSVAREPVWVFNNGPDAELISLEQGQLHHEVGLTRLVPTGTDLILTVPMSAEDAFSADQRPYFAVRYKYKTTITQAGLFFTTDRLTVLSDESYSPFAVVGDNTWRKAVVDLRTFRHGNWTGTITSFRFDPTNPSDTSSSYQISRLGFFATESEAQRFLDDAVDAPDYSEPTYFAGPLQRVLVPGGCLSDGFEQGDFMLPSAVVDHPCETTVVRFRTRGAGGAESIVPVCQTNRCGFTRFIAREAGEYRLSNESVSLVDVTGLPSQVQWAIRYAVARQLLDGGEGGRFRPGDQLSDRVWSDAVELLGGYEIDLTKEDKPSTRAAAALLLSKAVQTALGTAIESPYANEHFTRDRIRTGAWVNPSPEVIGPDFLKIYSSGGFDWIIAHGALAGSKHRDTLLQDCDRYGVELVLGDGAYMDPAVSTAEYFDHPCFAGTYVTDEPGTDQYDELATICNTYYAETDGKLPYINLLPMYANAAQLKYGASAAAIEYYDADPDLYRKYCDAFCEKFQVPYICTDIYPLDWSNGKRTTYSDYCESINVIAASARDHKKDFWCCIQTFAWVPSKRTPTESEFRWQSYCLLSFGCKGLLCWTYAGQEVEFPSLIAVDGNRTNAWYDVAAVFQEIRGVSDAFVQYKNIGAYAHNCSDQTPYLKFSNPVQEFPTIRQIHCDDPLLVGCFAKKDESATAFTLVNMSELEAVKTVDVSLDLAGSKVTAWPRGQRTELQRDSDGRYHLSLSSGEGVFVEVE